MLTLEEQWRLAHTTNSVDFGSLNLLIAEQDAMREASEKIRDKLLAMERKISEPRSIQRLIEDIQEILDDAP
jgi:hypothetical protein